MLLIFHDKVFYYYQSKKLYIYKILYKFNKKFMKYIKPEYIFLLIFSCEFKKTFVIEK